MLRKAALLRVVQRPQLVAVAVRGLAVEQKIPTSFDPTRGSSPQDKLLFTPGPLTSSYATKQAALRDMGSRDVAFIRVIKEVREGLLKVAGVSADEFTAIPIQGSGTFGVEAVLSSVIPKDKGLLLIANGAYGTRMHAMCKAHKIPCTMLEFPDDVHPSLEDIEKALKETKHSHVAVVHSETTSGIVNPIEKIGPLVRKYNKHFIVDAMSSFGGVPIDLNKSCIDYIVSSANKCIEGIPGFSFAIARKSALNADKGNASSVALDIHAQVAGLDKDGQFRFTPPTHALLAFRQALSELEAEGGIQARSNRYKENQRVLGEAMKKLGFELYLKPELQGYIISSYKFPKDKKWNFTTFYEKLNDRSFVIYPGKVTKADTFRIGHIGRIFPSDTLALTKAIEEVVKEMGLQLKA